MHRRVYFQACEASCAKPRDHHRSRLGLEPSLSCGDCWAGNGVKFSQTGR